MTGLLLALAALALAALGGLYYCCYRVFSVRRSATLDPFHLPAGSQYEERADEIHALIARAVALPYEDVFTRSDDGLRLHARYYEAAPDAPVQIMFHGYRSGALRDFAGGLPISLEAGVSALVVDERAHGQSEGRFLTLGVRERGDCLAWVRYVNERFGAERPVVLSGLSMGATTVLMTTALGLPENVVGVIGDCGYSSPEAILRKVLPEQGYPAGLFYPLVRLGGRLFGGFDVSSCGAPDALRRCRVPVLLIHGEDDRFVPCEMGRENYAACAAPKRLFTVPDAGHGLSYVLDPEGYRAAVVGFLGDVLGR